MLPALVGTISRLPVVGQVWTFVFGPPLPRELPERVERVIAGEQQQTEILVSLLQLTAVVAFAILYNLAPKGFDPDKVPFEPVPYTLAAYTLFTLVRLWFAWRLRLTPAFLAVSVVVDMAVLMATIWSFHWQYDAPAPLYLKAPTVMYVFILIALRTLRFDHRFVLLAGVTASLGWLALVAYALITTDDMSITRDFRVYMMSYSILLGAEFDKVVSMMMVTLILVVAIVRARKLLFRAVAEQMAAAELSRFFAPEVAGRIRASEIALQPGQAEQRAAAILTVDLRGFTPLSQALAPGEVMRLLSEYQSQVVGVVTAHGGSIDKFMGDGILASFGATQPSTTYACDALATVESLLPALERWRGERAAAGAPAPAVGMAVTTGTVMFGTIGDDQRLEYTVIGDPVNLAAKLEKHTKREQVRALCPAATRDLALAQGWQPALDVEPRPGRAVDGVDTPVDLVVLG